MTWKEEGIKPDFMGFMTKGRLEKKVLSYCAKIAKRWKTNRTEK